MSPLAGKIAIVTGAGSGIGRAISLALAEEGAALCLVGRNPLKLEAVAEAANGRAAAARCYPADLTKDASFGELHAAVSQDFAAADILVHNAGALFVGMPGRARVEEFDLQYSINVRAPYQLTQVLLPMLVSAQGQVVFINSSAGLNARAVVSQYSATKHALKAFADSLREEVNPHGVRVLSVYPGRCATPMLERLDGLNGESYCPSALLQPEDIASVVINALRLPRTAEVTDISIRPMKKA